MSNPLIQMTNCDGLRLKLDNATIAFNGPNVEVSKMDRCKATDVSMRGTKVVSGSGDRGRHGDGSLTLNHVVDSKGITIDQTGMSIKGRFSNVNLNKVVRSKGMKIFQKGADVDADYTDPNEAASHEASRGREHVERRFTANRIVASEDISVDQEDMSVSGRFDDIRVNDIESSHIIGINQKNMILNNEVSSSEDSDSDDDERQITEHVSVPPTSDNFQSTLSSKAVQPSGAKTCAASTEAMEPKKTAQESRQGENVLSRNPDHFDEDGLPKHNTYEYRIAEKVTFNVKLIGGGSVTCTRLQQDLIRNVINFIIKIHPPSGLKPFRLQDEETRKFVDGNPSATLVDAGFTDKMELRTVYDTS